MENQRRFQRDIVCYSCGGEGHLPTPALMPGTGSYEPWLQEPPLQQPSVTQPLRVHYNPTQSKEVLQPVTENSEFQSEDEYDKYWVFLDILKEASSFDIQRNFLYILRNLVLLFRILLKES